MSDALSALVASVPSFPVTRLFAGPLRCYACSAHAGLASTVWPAGHCCHVDVEFFGRSDLTSDEVATRLLSGNTFEASLAMATINSALPYAGLPLSTANARDLIIARAGGGVLGLIGHFCFLEKFRPHFSDILVFELDPGEEDLPASAIPERLREADVVAITGTTLINGTFPSVIRHVRSDAWVIMLGPSTPFAPVLFEHGVDALCGTIVEQPEIVARNASLAASPHRHEGTRQMILEAEYFKKRPASMERTAAGGHVP